MAKARWVEGLEVALRVLELLFLAVPVTVLDGFGLLVLAYPNPHPDHTPMLVGVVSARPRHCRDRRQSRAATAWSARRLNTVISFSACLSPLRRATSIPCCQACEAACASPAASHALPSSFQPAE